MDMFKYDLQQGSLENKGYWPCVASILDVFDYGSTYFLGLGRTIAPEG